MAIVRFLRRTSHLAVSLLLAAAALVFLVVFVAQVTGRYRFVPVLSGSMNPYVETGDVAILEPRDATDVIVGDVLAFEAPVDGSPLTLHRVVEVVSPAPELVVRTQGDANAVADPWQARLVEDRLWRATGHVDDVGTPIVFLNGQTTRFLLMAIAALLIGWWGMVAIWREDDDETDPEPEPPAEPPRRALALMPAFLLVVVAAGHSGAAEGASASLTASAAGSQQITSATTPGTTPPSTTTTTTTTTTPAGTFRLEADLVCSGTGTPTSVELSWTPTLDATRKIDIYRSSAPGGPFDRRLARVNFDVTSFSDPVTKADGLPRYYVVRSVGTPVEESNEVAVTSCDATPVR